MSTLDTLPVILISAINETAATELVSELIDNDVTENYVKDTQSVDRVWRLVNKYYTVNVRVHTLTDHGQLEVDPNTIEAHIIHITEEELSDEALALARAALHAHVWRGLVRTDRAAPPPHSEEAPSDASAGSSCSGSDDSDSEAEERRAVEQAEAFAAALGALGPALAARPGPGGAWPGPGEAPADRDQAEALVLAFCRALGLDPDAC